MIGFLQPFNDAIKLFSKEIIIPSRGNKIIYNISPVGAIALTLMVWTVIPFERSNRVSISLIYIYIIISIRVYPLFFSGWSSNRNYAIIGSLRGIAQTISYEIRFALIILFVILPLGSLGLIHITESGINLSKILLYFPIIGLWVISCLAETNRTPFDFAEGESELVSGFNIEYGAAGFALIFIAEYGRILFMGILLSLLFILSPTMILLNCSLVSAVVFAWVWVRTTLPRYRYDKLINLAWFTLLPAITSLIPYRLYLY